MNIRNFAFAIVAAAALGGCVTGYGYRGGAGDYYYGRPSVDYYGGGYGNYGYSGYGGYGYGYDYGYPYSYGGYYGGYYPGYYYYPYPRHPRPRPHHPTPPRHDGYVIPDNGVRYQSRYQTEVLGRNKSAGSAQGSAIGEPRYPSRYSSRAPQVRSGLESRGGPIQSAPPARMQPAAPRFEPPSQRPEPRFESRAPRTERLDSGARDLAPSRGSSRERDHGRVQTP